MLFRVFRGSFFTQEVTVAKLSFQQSIGTRFVLVFDRRTNYRAVVSGTDDEDRSCDIDNDGPAKHSRFVDSDR